MPLTTLTVSVASTVRIFTIRFTGITGIMIHIYTIRFITPHGIRLITVGDGEEAGIHLIIVWVGVILLITVTGTVHITEDIMADITEDITAATLIITTGMVPEAAGMLIRKTTGTDKDGQPVPMYSTAMRMAGEVLLLQSGHLPTRLKVPAKGLPHVLPKTAGEPVQVRV